MMEIFEILHPDCIALIAFDNSSNHHVMAKDALVASRPNLKDGGKNVLLMRLGWYLNINGESIVQEMMSAEGKQKGIRSILTERGLFVGRMELKEARNILSKQDDLREEKSLLEETVSSKGHEIIFIVNFILSSTLKRCFGVLAKFSPGKIVIIPGKFCKPLSPERWIRIS
jgi:hypothetical protein